MRGILFDKDGTLLDFEATWTPVLRRLALEAAAGDADRAERLLELGGLVRATGKFRAGSAIGAGTTATIVEVWHPELSGGALAEAIVAMDRAFLEHGRAHSVPLPGAVDTVATLAGRGLTLGVATNDATAAAKAAIAAVSLSAHLPHIYGYDSVTRSKPAPDMVLAFARDTSLAASDIAVVGDNPHDMEMARAAGAVAIGVTSGNSSAADLAPLADVVLPSVAALPEWLDANAG
ncbi:MAG TPA: HAD family hydrolase [Bauldia sp.]|nr:HAD family hydrolase [Bauldia sp.]